MFNLDYFTNAKRGLTQNSQVLAQQLQAQRSGLDDQILTAQKAAVPSQNMTGTQVAGALISSILPLLLAKGTTGQAAALNSAAVGSTNYFAGIDQQNQERAKLAQIQAQELVKQRTNLDTQMFDVQKNYVNQSGLTDRAMANADIQSQTQLMSDQRFNRSQEGMNDRAIMAETVRSDNALQAQKFQADRDSNQLANQSWLSNHKTSIAELNVLRQLDDSYTRMIALVDKNGSIPRTQLESASFKAISDSIFSLLRLKTKSGAALSGEEAALIERGSMTDSWSEEIGNSMLGRNAATKLKALQDNTRAEGYGLETVIGDPPSPDINYNRWFSKFYKPQEQQGQTQQVGQTAQQGQPQQPTLAQPAQADIQSLEEFSAKINQDADATPEFKQRLLNIYKKNPAIAEQAYKKTYLD